MWPFLVQSDSLDLPTYIVVNSAVFSLGVLWTYFRAPSYDLNQSRVLDVSLAVMIGGFIGARAMHILVEYPRYYWEHPGFVFKIWYGGFVYYGGVIGAAGLAWMTCRYRRQNFWAMGDLMAPVLAMGSAFGRLGCLAAGCCYGSPTTMPWGIHFPKGAEAPAGIALHPTQLYAFLWEFPLALVLLHLEKKAKRTHGTPNPVPGRLFGLWIAFHGLGRALVEQFRGDFRGPNLFNLSVSTWLSGLAIILGIYVVATHRWTSRKEIGPHAPTAI